MFPVELQIERNSVKFQWMWPSSAKSPQHSGNIFKSGKRTLCLHERHCIVFSVRTQVLYDI